MIPTRWRHNRWGGGRSGFVDRSGKIAIPLRFDAARSLSEGMAAVGVDRTWGFIDTTGNIAVPPQYDTVWDFSHRLAMVKVTREGSRDRYIDRGGHIVWEGH